MDFLKSTEFGRIIPKERFYKTAAEKELFTKQVARIRWANKIAPDTLNIAKGAAVAEIEVIELELNVPFGDLDKRVLPLIKKAIPYKLVFVIAYGGATMFTMCYDDKRCYTAAEPPKLTGGDTDSVWENFVRHLAGDALGKGETLAEQVGNGQRRTRLEHEIAALANKIRREKQLNRQMEMNNEIKRLKAELEEL